MTRTTLSLFSFLCTTLAAALPASTTSSSSTPAINQYDYTSLKFSYPRLYPESFTYDRQTQSFITGSLTSGDIVSITKTGRATRLFRNPVINGTLGVYLDDKRLLHSAVFANNLFIGYARYDLNTKVPADTGLNTGVVVNMNAVFTYPAGPKGHGINDVGTDGKGNKYLTDTFGNLVAKLDSNDQLTVLANGSSIFNTTTLAPLSTFSADYSVNGIKYLPTCNTILTGTLGKGQLFTINPTTKAVRQVITGRQISVDGLTVISDSLVLTATAVGGSVVTYWTSKDCWKTASVVKQVDLRKAGFNGGDPGITAVVGTEGGVPWVLGAYINEYNAAPGQGNRTDYLLFKLPGA